MRHRARGVVYAVDTQASNSTGSASASTSATAAIEDKFLARTLAQFETAHETHASLAQLRSSSWAAARSLRMPSTRSEEYRFTDISPLLRATLSAPNINCDVHKDVIASLVPSECSSSYAVLVNGVLRPELSQLHGLPAGVYVGGLAGAPAAVTQLLGTQSSSRGGPFALLNGAAALEVLVVDVPAAAQVDTPLYVLTITTVDAHTTPAVMPRLLVHVGAGAAFALVEEHLQLSSSSVSPLPLQSASTSSGGGDASSGPASVAGSTTSAQAPYFSCPLAEVFLAQDAQFRHGYACREQAGALHFKATLVEQAESSSYTLTESRIGGGLTRHDVVVQQAGPRTDTQMRHFLLAATNQLHDLHSKLVLDHPEGTANQLHKCIVAASTGRGVFDGNVKVNRLAQRSDAGQLSRNLLLAPKATVNVKPNLQIIADDVKCTHGCAVSDLSDEELFYFRARGISALSARQALVASFGAEVTQGLKLKDVMSRVQADVKVALANAGFLA